MGMYTALMETIEAYTSLSPMALFTILALMVGVYRLVCGMFVAPEAQGGDVKTEKAIHQPMVAPPVFAQPAEPVQLGEVTEQELRGYDGSDPKKPLLMAIKGNIYDVSRSRMFYGPGGPYALFAGRDASRALALMSFDTNDLTGNIEGLSRSELEVLEDWEYKFMEKYVKVGRLVTERTRAEDVITARTMAEETQKEEEICRNQDIKKEAIDNDSQDFDISAAETEAGKN